MWTRTGFAVVILRQPFMHTFIQAGCLAFLLFLFMVPSHAETPSIPWECSTYKDNAQTRCLNTLIELQREKVAHLEGQLRAQDRTVSQLKDQVDRQTAVNATLQQRLSDRQSVNLSRIFYPLAPYQHFYPPALGFGIYLGNPWAFGPFHLHGPLWHQPYYGSWQYSR